MLDQIRCLSRMKEAAGNGTFPEILKYLLASKPLNALPAHLSTTFVALPMHTISKPVAMGSRVPACPTYKK